MPSAERLAIMRDRIDRGEPGDLLLVWLELRAWVRVSS
jgi:hypothetical protein